MQISILIQGVISVTSLYVFYLYILYLECKLYTLSNFNTNCAQETWFARREFVAAETAELKYLE